MAAKQQNLNLRKDLDKGIH